MMRLQLFALFRHRVEVRILIVMSTFVAAVHRVLASFSELLFKLYQVLDARVFACSYTRVYANL